MRAHAVLHCNLNSVELAPAEAFYTSTFGVTARMRSTTTDSDATAMGLGASTASDTCFLYDGRGPRAAPALELVRWWRPETSPRDEGVGGFAAAGFRVASLAGVRPVGAELEEVVVRGRPRPSVTLVDPDGVSVEVVEIGPAPEDPDGGIFSHVRLRCTDLGRTASWYAAIGFSMAGTSLVLPEDPTFSLELERHPGPIHPGPANTQGLYRIALAVDDVRAAHAALCSDRGWELPEPVFIPMPDTPTGGFTVLFMADPDGAVVELVERPRSAVRRPMAPI
jgi:catechol 2,3-dioxygenase-like lactoylglutathione lyase family enzyme